MTFRPPTDAGLWHLFDDCLPLQIAASSSHTNSDGVAGAIDPSPNGGGARAHGIGDIGSVCAERRHNLGVSWYTGLATTWQTFAHGVCIQPCLSKIQVHPFIVLRLLDGTR